MESVVTANQLDCLYCSVETLNDIMTEAVDLKTALSKGLRFIIETIGVAGGIVYVKSATTGDVDSAVSPFNWVSYNLPGFSIDQLEQPDGALASLALQVLTTGQTLAPDKLIGLASGIPLTFKAECFGALLIFDKAGSELGSREVAGETSINLLAHQLSRKIAHDQLHRVRHGWPEELDTLQLFNASQNTVMNIDDIQLRVSNSIRHTINGEAVVLILLQSEDGLVLKKVLGDQLRWISQYNSKLENGLVADCIHNGAFLAADSTDTALHFNPDFDTIDSVGSRSIVCIPLNANGNTLGAIEVLGHEKFSLTSYDEGVLLSMTTALANAMFSARLIRELKVVNADLEASRWELLRSRNTLRALFDSIPSSIYIIDKKYNLIAINISRAERIKSVPNLLVGRKCYEALEGAKEPCPGCKVSETLLNGINTNRSSRKWITNDQPLDWDISTYPIRDDNNTLIQSIIIEQNVTEKRRLEENLVQSEKLAAVGQLAAGVAHEINNPLAAIIANAQILKRDLPRDDDFLESVKLIELAGIRASQVVRNLLGFARKEQYEFTPTDLNSTIQNALTLLQHEILSRSVTIVFDLEENLPPAVASKDHLQGVWTNLLLNAIDAIENGHGLISIKTRYLSNEFRITFTDNGKGIPPDKISRIFEPFYTTKAPGRGTGLGLSNCHRIVKQHGGYITVDSQVGGGTSFTVILPAREGSAH